MPTPAANRRELQLAIGPQWLTVRFDREHSVLSSAIVGGGFRRTREVTWHEVRDRDLTLSVDPARLLARRLAARGLSNSVGLLTSRNLSHHVTSESRYDAISAQVVATVGLSNALRVGDPPGAHPAAGTINILCRISEPLMETGLIEMLSLIAEARTLAMLEAGLGSRRSGLPATGTGTDCIVAAAPVARRRTRYAGKHTAIGHVVGTSVTEALRRGIAAWVAEQRPD